MKRRALVIGIDGMPHTLLERLASAGVMPFVRELLGDGELRSLRAPVPEVSSTSWATFLTGTTPAHHGIFGFTDVDAEGRVFFPTLDHLSAPAAWDHVARAGGRTVCLNVPATYPARPMDGVLVSGFVAPLPERAFYPPALRDAADEMQYVLDVDAAGALDDPRAFLTRLHQALDARAELFTHVLSSEQPDLGIAVVTESDRLQHFLWDAVVDPLHALHDAVLDVYRHIDAVVARVAATSSSRDALFLVSDHGFGLAQCTFNVTQWLREEGLLALPHGLPLAAIDSRTAALALDPARVFVHDRARFRRGREVDARPVARDIRDRLRALRWTPPDRIGLDGDLPLFRDAFLREELDDGPGLTRCADVLAVPSTGVALRASPADRSLVGPPGMPGMHTRDGATFFARGTHLPPGEIDMHHVLPAVLDAIGIPIQEGVVSTC